MNLENLPDRELLAELLLRWEELYECGQDTPATELARDHPHLISELSRRIRALKTVSWVKDPPVVPSVSEEPMRMSRTGSILGGRYRLEQLVAEGGFAEVYRAYDTELQRSVAVKVPRPDRLHSSDTFLAEARRVARLKHDGIVPVYDVGVESDICFIVSEFLEGGSLADRLSRGRPTTQEAIRWTTEVAEALEHAHSQGIVHRDVKPANVLVDQHGRAKLADFGIAQSALKTGTFSPSLGTLPYMSPEQVQGGAVDHRSDIYSLAVVLYEALTGRLPYGSVDSPGIRRDIIDGRLHLTSPIAAPLVSVIRKATNPSPHIRHTSAREFADALRAAAAPSAVISRMKTAIALIFSLAGLACVFFLVSSRTSLQVSSSPDTHSRGVARIPVQGLGSVSSVTAAVHRDWCEPGVFAEIGTPGTADFARVSESAYVVEADLSFKNPRGRIAMFFGEPKNNIEVCIGDLWGGDAQHEKAVCRLFRGQPFGPNWNGEAFLDVATRTRLTLVVADDAKVLLRDGREFLRNTGDPSDFCLHFAAMDGAVATFYSMICRALTTEDCLKVGVPFPLRQLKCDEEFARVTLRDQVGQGWATQPMLGSNYVLGRERLALVWVAPGAFTMGNPNAPHLQWGKGREQVLVSRGYWIGKYEVTQGQWQEVLGDNPSRIKGSALLPVNNISWSDAMRFCKALTARERRANRIPEGYEYRLPTEAEWEFACRAGTNEEFVIPRDEIAHRGGKYQHLVQAGTTPANPWGLHETLGNVAEWCLDRWEDYREGQEQEVVDRFYEGDPDRSMFVVRGDGFWETEVFPSSFVRTRRRDIAGGFRGFRVVLGPTIALKYMKPATSR